MLCRSPQSDLRLVLLFGRWVCLVEVDCIICCNCSILGGHRCFSGIYHEICPNSSTDLMKWSRKQLPHSRLMVWQCCWRTNRLDWWVESIFCWKWLYLDGFRGSMSYDWVQVRFPCQFLIEENAEEFDLLTFCDFLVIHGEFDGWMPMSRTPSE